MHRTELRAWHPNQKTMIHHRINDRNWYTEYNNNIQFKDDDHYAREFDRMYVMQFTGIKDKSGKKIFYKDIVRLSVFLYTVEWCDLSCKFFLKSINNIDGHKYTMSKCQKGVVEGNIYENPELLSYQVTVT